MMVSKMRPYSDPDFVNSIISAINEKKLILFIGAGFSKLCGLPLWNDLANSLLDECVNDENIKLNHAGKNLINRDKDSKMLITIAYYLHEEANKVDNFNTLLFKSLSTFENSNEITNRREKLKDLIKKSGATVLTTNSDCILHDCFSDKKYIHYNLNDITRFHLNGQRHLLHLHGCIEDMNTMVYTVKQYLDRYSNPGFKRTIKNIFNSDSTILFLGYGLNEMQLLDFLVDQTGNVKNRYIIDGFFKHEDADFIAKQHYYSSFELKLISYYRDDNNYLALIDALEFLINEAQAKSQMKSINYNEAIELLKCNPTSKVTKQFYNTVMTLSLIEQKSIIEKITESPHMNKWIRYAVSNDIFQLFNIDVIFQKSSIQGLNNQDLFGFYLVNEIYKKEKSLYLYNHISNFISKMCKFSQLDALLVNNHFGRTLITLIFSDSKLINKYLGFIEKNVLTLNEYKEWVSYLLYEPNEVISSNKSNILKINSLVINHFYENKYHDFEFENYVDKVGISLMKKYPQDILKQLDKIFKRISTKKIWSYGEVGSLIQYYKNRANKREDLNSIILYWYIDSLDFASKEYLIDKFNQMIVSPFEIQSKIALVLLDKHFDTLRSCFFTSDENHFNNWNLYSDIYVFIDNKWDLMSFDEKNDIKQRIDNMEITQLYEFYNLVCKMDLIELIGTKNNENEYKIRASAIKNKFTLEENDKYQQFAQPSLRNRRSWSSSYTITDDEDFKREILSSDIEGFISKTAKQLNSFQSHTINTIYIDFFDNNNLIEWLEKSELKKLDLVHKDFLNLVLKYLINTNTPVSYQLLRQVYSKTLTLLDENEHSYLTKNFISDLYYIYYKKIVDQSGETYRKIYEDISSIYTNTDHKWVLNSESNNRITWHSILSNDIYQTLSLLIMCSRDGKIDEIITLLNINITNSSDSIIVKAIITANVGLLWEIDKEWVKSNIYLVFDNEFKGQNISFLGFQLSQYYGIEFINLIEESGVLSKIFESKDFNENKWAFIHNLLVFIRKYEKSDRIIEYIATTDNNFGGIHSYFSEVLKINISEEVESDINYICQKLVQFYVVNKRANGALVKVLLNIYPKLICKTKLWNFILSLVPYTETYYTKEIVAALSSLNINNSELINFVTLYINSLNDHFYYLNDLYSLIMLPNWDLSENIKQELINKVASYNPSFWELFKR